MSPFANALTDADRFWSKVDRTGDCWYWQGAVDANGYGRLQVGGEMMRAHYVAWFLVMGEWPKETLYRNCPSMTKPKYRWTVNGWVGRRSGYGDPKLRLCVRPQHLREGRADNAVPLLAATNP